MSESNHPSPTEPNQRLERYLDGLMSAEEAAAFEAEAAGDAALQREIDLQQQVDGSLGRMFAPPTGAVDILALAATRTSTADEPTMDEPTVELAKPAETQPPSRRRTLLTVLAACVAWVIAGWMIYNRSGEEGYRELALAEIYDNCVDAGFTPKWVCEDDAEFAQTFQQRQGRPLLLKPESRDVMVGLSYLSGITPETTTMLARVDGEPVLVFVERLDRDTQPEEPSMWSGLNLFRAELEDLVLYEVTPLDEPRVLSSFYIPEPSEIPEPTVNPDTSEQPESASESAPTSN